MTYYAHSGTEWEPLQVHLTRVAGLARDFAAAGTSFDAFHLSTAMCPKHREAVLAEVRSRLARGEGCALVTTQCVEAGVDLDFPAVFRALGPLDAIAPAAGRCNRNGRNDAGEVRIFVPEDERYPQGVYRQATA